VQPAAPTIANEAAAPRTAAAVDLQISRIGKRFGGATVLDDLDLSVAKGEFVSLLGPSGCGKTTTLRMIAGFIDPTAGTIAMDGQMLSSPSGSLPPEKRQMSMIFQSYAVWPNMTVEQNVAFGLELRKLPRMPVTVISSIVSSALL